MSSKGQNGTPMNGERIIRQLKKKFRLKSDQELAEQLGVTCQSILNWRGQNNVSDRQIAGLVFKARLAGKRHANETAIRPIVEFFPVEKCKSRANAKYQIFNSKTANGESHSYLIGLRDELQSQHGIYIFFDSRGQAIYAGKARRQTLWNEINLAFNRERGAVQKIKRVTHPKRQQPYKNSREKSRQIEDHVVLLHELAAYVSVYQVSDDMVNDLEAMLVRSFANDLLNKRMEKFSTSRSKQRVK